MYKVCSKCNRNLDFAYFNKHKKGQFGLYPDCRKNKYLNLGNINQPYNYILKENIKFKNCNKCNLEKSIDEYYKNKSNKSGYQNICKKCHKNSMIKKKFD